MLNICLSEWSSYHINYHIHLVLIVCCINHLIESRTIRYQIDEELKINTPIGNLLSNIQSGVQNIRFIKISSTDDSSALFSVDQYSGDITIDHRLDREHLCSQSDRINKPDTYENLVTDWKSNVLTTQSTKCELYFSVNCLNVTPIKNLGNQNKSKTPVSNKLVAIFDVVVELRDINDNGCKFMPSSEQIIRIREDSPIHETRLTLNTPYDPDDAILGNTVKSDLVWIRDPSSKLYSFDNRDINATFKLHSLSSLYNENIKLELELVSELDYESRQNYTFEIVADDGFPSGGHQCHLNVTVLVEDCNDHTPVFDQSTYVANVSEDTIIGQTIVKVTANDADDGENRRVLYSLDSYTDNTDDSNLFYIHEDTGEIRLQRRLNHRLKPQHILKVFAKNPGHTLSRNMKSLQTLSKSSTAQVIVNVIDTNDHFPRIRILSPTGSKTLEIIEESPPGQDIGILDVSDGDTGKNAEVNCNLTNQTITGVLSLIPMNSEIIGKEVALSNRKYKITLEKRIDREEYPSIEVTILCRDSGIPRLTSTLTQSIKIIDVNDHDPISEQSVYMVEVTEDSDPQRSKDNFELITIHATDKDEGQNAKLHFALDEETPVHLLNVVTVDSNSGVLRTLGNLDREQLNAFTVTVVCADHGETQRMTKVFINVRVLDYNDNSPTFSQPYFEFLLKENNPVGQLIGYFEVTDNDIGENAELEIYIEENLERSQVHLTALNNNLKLSNDVKQLRFHSGGLFSSSGIRQRKYMDYSSKFKLSYQKRPKTNISASVSGPTLYDIQLYAESIIDRESLFLRDAAVFPSDLLPNYESFDSSTTTTTTAHNNNNYKYSELSKLSSQTNYSTVTPTIFLLIRAQDKGIPKLSEHVSIRVHILDDNDNSPRFLYPDSYSINKTKVILSYKEPVDYAFTQIQAVDDDAGENGTITYFIHSGNNEGYFKLNKHSGVLSVNKEISYSAIGEHLLRIEARDGGQPYRFTMAELIIEIDQSASKAYLTMDAYNFNGFSGFFNFGASGYTLNFYIIVGIITSACIISTVLITFVFVFLRKNKQQRNFQHIPIASDRNGNSNNNNNNINHGETNMTNSPLSWQKVDQMNSYEFGTIPGGYGVIQPLPDCLSQFSAIGGNSSLQLLNYPNGSIYSSPNTRDFHTDRRNSPEYFKYMENRNNYLVDDCNNNNNINNINRTNYCNYNIDNNISSNDTNYYNDTIGSRKIKIFIPRSHHDTINVMSTTHDESTCTDFKYPYKACSNYFNTEMQEAINPIQSYPACLNN